MRHDLDRVDVNEVQEVESAEGEDQRTEPRALAQEPDMSEKDAHPDNRRDVSADDLEIKRHIEGQESVDQKVEGMGHAGLPFAVQKKAGVERWRPQERIAGPERLAIEEPDRQ